MQNDTNQDSVDLAKANVSESNQINFTVSNEPQGAPDQNGFDLQCPTLNGIGLRGVSLSSPHMSHAYPAGKKLLGMDVKRFNLGRDDMNGTTLNGSNLRVPLE